MDLISREALIAVLQKYKFGAITNETEREYTKDIMLDFVADQPTIDAVPVVRGEWIMRGGRFYCTNCGKKALEERDRDDWYGCVTSDWCPHCGADMTGK